MNELFQILSKSVKDKIKKETFLLFQEKTLEI